MLLQNPHPLLLAMFYFSALITSPQPKLKGCNQEVNEYFLNYLTEMLQEMGPSNIDA